MNTGVGKMGFARRVRFGPVGFAILTAPLAINMANAQSISGRSPAAIRPKFEVASVKPCKDGGNLGAKGGGRVSGTSPGRMTLKCQTVKDLIGAAYVLFADGQFHLPSSSPQILGGPGWINSERYDIDAKAEGIAKSEMMQGPMLQTLLEDRFKLKIHRGTKEIPVYNLIVAKDGPKLQPFKEGSCTPNDFLLNPSPPQLAPGQPPYCHRRIARQGSNWKLDMQATSIDDFCKLIRLDLPIINQTGITGLFDFPFEYAADDATTPVPPSTGGDLGAPGAAVSDPASAPAIFAVFQKALGLKLERGKGGSDSIVIDHIEKPTRN